MWRAWICVGSLLLLGASLVTAQGECAADFDLDAILSDARERCSTSTDGICAGTEGTLLNDAAVAAGQSVALSDAGTITLDPVDTLPITVLNITAGGQTVNAVLYGGATLENRVTERVGEPVVLKARNAAGYPINLRAGAGTQFAEAGALDNRAEVLVDGRTNDSEWVRVQSDAGTAWVRASLLSIEGAISSLLVVDSAYTDPFQSILLATSDYVEGDCVTVRGGLLLQNSADQAARINVNDVEISLSQATVLVQAPEAASQLVVQVLKGQAGIAVGRETRTLATGAAATVQLDIQTQLAAGAPSMQDRFVFANVASAPLDLLPESSADLCLTGVPLNVAEREARSGPGEAYSAFAALDNRSHYQVEGYATDDAGRTWFKLGNGRWTPALNNDLLGACSAFVEVAAPPLTVNASPVQQQNVSLVPTQNTRYQAYSGNDVMTGQCNSQPTAVCDHLAVIVPNGDGTFGWRGQEPVTYQMTPVSLNRFLYNGRNFQNNANLSLDLTFAGNAWTMTMTTIFDNHPTCTHTFYYTAQRLN